MDIVTLGTVSLLFLGLVSQKILQKRAEKSSQTFFFLAVLLVVISYVVLVYLQYLAWQEAPPPARYLVPPYQSLEYVFGYQFARFGVFYLISLGISGLFLWGTWLLDKKFSNRLFYPGERYLGGMTIFLLGNPAWDYLWMYYLGGLLLLAFLASVISEKVLKKDTRLPLKWFWIPVAIIGIIIHEAFL